MVVDNMQITVKKNPRGIDSDRSFGKKKNGKNKNCKIKSKTAITKLNGNRTAGQRL